MFTKNIRNKEVSYPLENVLEPYEDHTAEPYDYDNPMDDVDPDDAELAEEEENAQKHFRIASGMLNTVSILVGILAVMLLSWLLFSLIAWLSNDLNHSILLFENGIG